MRYYLALDNRPTHQSVTELLLEEKISGLDSIETLRDLFTRFQNNAMEFKKILIELNAKGKKVIGYGATSKSATILNFAGIGPDLIEAISDTTPGKVGLCSPGKHIPIISYQDFCSANSDVVILFAWNHMSEIFEKENLRKNDSTTWLVPFPMPFVTIE